jgi:hypothetical protein
MQDLFEQWVIIQGWAGRAGRRGRCSGKSWPIDSLEAGIAALKDIAQRHSKQGRTLVS